MVAQLHNKIKYHAKQPIKLMILHGSWKNFWRENILRMISKLKAQLDNSWKFKEILLDTEIDCGYFYNRKE